MMHVLYNLIPQNSQGTYLNLLADEKAQTNKTEISYLRLHLEIRI